MSRDLKVAEGAAMTDDRDGFAEWLANSSEPKLEDLISRSGSYSETTK